MQLGFQKYRIYPVATYFKARDTFSWPAWCSRHSPSTSVESLLSAFKTIRPWSSLPIDSSQFHDEEIRAVMGSS